MVDGQVTTNLDDFDGYKPGDLPWNPLGLGWYFNWNWTHGIVCDQSGEQCIEYMPLVGGWGPGVHPTLAQIQTQIAAYPGRYPDGTTWLIGNEIIWTTSERRCSTHRITMRSTTGLRQSTRPSKWPTDRSSPRLLHATRLHGHSIGTAGCDPGGLPVGVWGALAGGCVEHPPLCLDQAVLAEELADFQSQLGTFRDWMAGVGEQDKPLIITSTAC